MAIDRKKIINELSKIEIVGNEEGLIPGYGVLITQLPGDFWNEFAMRVINAGGEDLYEDVKGLLVNAAHECGYHTGYGIITSDEWNAVVKPMVEKVPEDILHGAFAVFTAWGWAKAEIVELIPKEKMVVRTYDYYESDVVKYGVCPHFTAYMITGVCGAFMDLAYGRKEYPDGLYTFRGEQVKGIEKGDDYGEFVVTKA